MSTSRLEKMREMVAKAPGHALARYGLANELVKAGLHGEAVETLQSYLAEHDDQGSAFRLLAESLVALNRADEAMDAYRKGIDAAMAHGHPGMADEFRMKLEDLEDA